MHACKAMTALHRALLLLPTRTGGAAENMASDFLLLSRCPGPPAARFRHYEWRGPAFTFGFSQKLDWVRANLPPGETFDLCRRPTGGGIVDHRNDWTYALIVPRGHALYDERASASYRLVHESLADALVAMGEPAELQCACAPGAPDTGTRAGGNDGGGAIPGVCFQQAERFDVVNARTGAKIAGAAQKRSQQGMLFQGSIGKSTVGALDWDAFQAKFTVRLAAALGVGTEEAPWPDLAENEVEGLIERYSSPEWLAYR